MLFDHVLHQRLTRCGHVSLAFFLKIEPRLFQHMHRQRERGLVQHRQRPDRHTSLHGGVLNHRRRDTFAQHGRALHHEGAKGAAGVETA